MNARIPDLLQRLRALWEARAANPRSATKTAADAHDETALAAADALAVWPATLPPDACVTGIRHPVAEYLNTALSVPAGNPVIDGILAALREVAPVLPWKYNYAPGRGGAADAGRVAWAELIGPVAPVVSDELCVGVTLIAPLTLYPAHHHPAAELYGVLSGTARWQSPAADRDRTPGEFIYHQPGIVHAMETHDQPLLAAYTWTGDVKTWSVYV
jgi:quercetin dioxygenase-like cupin family protein